MTSPHSHLASFEMQDVRQHLQTALKQEIMDFWEQEGALNSVQAAQRVEQVFQVVRSVSTGQMMGVCTAFPQWIESLQLPFYYYRSFTGQADRQGGIGRALLAQSYQILNQEYRIPDAGTAPAPVGMLLDIENPLLKSFNWGVWRSSGDFFFAGRGPNGNHIRIAYFEDARIQ
ncbi:MAG: hypothetical protein ACO1RX_01030 [Candidatus Sericytochromatia bacterium]